VLTILDGLLWALVVDAVTASGDSSRELECVDVCNTLVVRLINYFINHTTNIYSSTTKTCGII
jgi:hypothetical protein